MKNCLFCGTFNPIHNAHIRAAEHVMRKFGFDNIIFIPSYIAPHKEVSGCTAQDRLNMVKLAISKNAHFSVSDAEFLSETKSYTYNTIKKLNEEYKNNEKWPFIIGTDAFRKIESWYQADELKQLLKFIVLPRDKYFDTEEFEKLKLKGYDFEFTNLNFYDISSTDIRNKIQNNEIISEYVPKRVENYIYERNLYRKN